MVRSAAATWLSALTGSRRSPWGLPSSFPARDRYPSYCLSRRKSGCSSLRCCSNSFSSRKMSLQTGQWNGMYPAYICWPPKASRDGREVVPTLEWWEMGLRLLAAAALGGLIGFEREYNEQPAGFRTHILVTLGAALFTMAGAYGTAAFVDADVVRFDPTRVAAQVVTGIGFLGAGAILRQGINIRGLTTVGLPSDQRQVILNAEVSEDVLIEDVAEELRGLEGVSAVDWT